MHNASPFRLDRKVFKHPFTTVLISISRPRNLSYKRLSSRARRNSLRLRQHSNAQLQFQPHLSQRLSRTGNALLLCTLQLLLKSSSTCLTHTYTHEKQNISERARVSRNPRSPLSYSRHHLKNDQGDPRARARSAKVIKARCCAAAAYAGMR